MPPPTPPRLFLKRNRSHYPLHKTPRSLWVRHSAPASRSADPGGSLHPTCPTVSAAGGGGRSRPRPGAGQGRARAPAAAAVELCRPLLPRAGARRSHASADTQVGFFFFFFNFPFFFSSLKPSLKRPRARAVSPAPPQVAGNVALPGVSQRAPRRRHRRRRTAQLGSPVRPRNHSPETCPNSFGKAAGAPALPPAPAPAGYPALPSPPHSPHRRPPPPRPLK